MLGKLILRQSDSLVEEVRPKLTVRRTQESRQRKERGNSSSSSFYVLDVAKVFEKFLGFWLSSSNYLYHVWNTQAWHGHFINHHGFTFTFTLTVIFDRNMYTYTESKEHAHNTCTAVGTCTFERWLASETEQPVGKNPIDEWKFDNFSRHSNVASEWNRKPVGKNLIEEWKFDVV